MNDFFHIGIFRSAGNEHGEVGERTGKNQVGTVEIHIVGGAHVLEIVIIVFRMQPDEFVHVLRTLGEFHDDDSLFSFYVASHFVGCSRAGKYGQCLGSADKMDAGSCTGCYK